jgi:hypothetical protein
LAEEGARIELIQAEGNPQEAARLIERFQEADGKPYWSPFRVVETFASWEAALAYAELHKITIEK